MRLILFFVLLSLIPVAPAAASVNVVATLPWIGSLAREIGGDKVTVTTLVKPSQDPHMIEAKPSMILAGRKADIIMYNGLDLEIGYLPRILESARNPRIVPGKPGNLDCSRFVRVLEKPASVDRSMGDVHPLGNPHYHYSPANILRVAEGMTQALTMLDPADAASFQVNFRHFADKMHEKQRQWSTIPLKGKKYVAYHKLFEYLADSFGFRIIDYVEPKPGIPPSAGHLESLIQTMRNARPNGIITTSLYGAREARTLSDRTGVKVITLPSDVGSPSETTDWFSFMDTVLANLK